jgi:hypothetical protein
VAPYAYSLLLTTPEAYQAGELDPGPLPADVPAVFPEAAPMVSTGLLLGEVLGIDTTDAVEALDVATRATVLRRETDDDAERLLFDDDLEVLRDTFADIAAAASAAIDADSRPTGEAGERLKDSEHVSLDEAGQAFIGTRRIRVADLADGLPDLVRFLDHAARNDLLVVDR